MLDGRFFAFFGENSVSMAMNSASTGDNEHEIVIALAFCNHRDQFNKKIARKILDGRINHHLKDGDKTDLVFSITYHGCYPKRDVMTPIMRRLRGLHKKRTHDLIHRATRSIQFFLDEMVANQRTLNQCI